jgi:isopenicillin-N N-acyltransferase-like protein
VTGRGVPHVRAAGDHFAIGRRHGRARAAQLRAFLDDGLARLAHTMPTTVSMESLAPMLGDYRAAIAQAAPGLAEEIRGLADGAGIAADEAVVLQLRRGIAGYLKVGVAAECTT